MDNRARERILRRLHKAAAQAPDIPPAACLPIATYDRAQRLERLTALMSAMRTHIETGSSRDWVHRLQEILKNRNLKRLLYSPETEMGRELKAAWPANPQGLPALCSWKGRIEEFKDELFHIDAAITTTRGAIAETGAIVLWPDEKEPRLMSLVPPVHIAILAADRIYNSFCDIIQAEKWPDHMPTNALLISGPSKTADIEMTLAFGVHGPRELIVLIIDET
ncbi:MAG: lactate utilization protein [Desulfobacterales bacterium]